MRWGRSYFENDRYKKEEFERIANGFNWDVEYEDDRKIVFIYIPRRLTDGSWASFEWVVRDWVGGDEGGLIYEYFIPEQRKTQ